MAERPLSLHESIWTGQIGNFAARTPRELLARRQIAAAPATAEKLRSVYDLEVHTSVILREGEVYIWDSQPDPVPDVRSRALEELARDLAVPRPRTLRDAIVITGLG